MEDNEIHFFNITLGGGPDTRQQPFRRVPFLLICPTLNSYPQTSLKAIPDHFCRYFHLLRVVAAKLPVSFLERTLLLSKYCRNSYIFCFLTSLNASTTVLFFFLYSVLCIAPKD